MEIDKIFDKYESYLKLDPIEEKKWKKKCITIIEFNNLEEVDSITIPNYTALEDWIMVNNLDELNNR